MCKQLRPLPWVRGQWQWCYGSNMSIIIIIIIHNNDYRSRSLRHVNRYDVTSCAFVVNLPKHIYLHPMELVGR